MSQVVRPAFRNRGSGGSHQRRQALAWCVHLYTAMGLVAAALMAVLIVRGGDQSFLWAFVLMVAATLIDATDGTLARAIQVKKVLPEFDGRRLDDLVDYLTYVALPLLLIRQAGILPEAYDVWLLVPLLASAYGFCQVHAKTADGFFRGFPSCWNAVAFYLYVLHFHVAPLASWFSLTLLLGFSVLTFIPSRYLYPSQRGRLNRLTNVFAAIWGGLVVAILVSLLNESDGRGTGHGAISGMVLASTFFPVYYLVASWAISWKLRRSARLAGPSHQAAP